VLKYRSWKSYLKLFIAHRWDLNWKFITVSTIAEQYLHASNHSIISLVKRLNDNQNTGQIIVDIGHRHFEDLSKLTKLKRKLSSQLFQCEIVHWIKSIVTEGPSQSKTSLLKRDGSKTTLTNGVISQSFRDVQRKSTHTFVSIIEWGEEFFSECIRSFLADSDLLYSKNLSPVYFQNNFREL